MYYILYRQNCIIHIVVVIIIIIIIIIIINNNNNNNKTMTVHLKNSNIWTQILWQIYFDFSKKVPSLKS